MSKLLQVVSHESKIEEMIQFYISLPQVNVYANFLQVTSGQVGRNVVILCLVSFKLGVSFR